MSKTYFKSPLVTGERYQLYMRKTEGDNLMDFTGASFSLVIASKDDVSQVIFSYLGSDVFDSVAVVEQGVYPLIDDNGNALDYNLQVTVPEVATSQLKGQDISNVRLGLKATMPSLEGIQLIPDALIEVVEGVA